MKTLKKLTKIKTNHFKTTSMLLARQIKKVIIIRVPSSIRGIYFYHG